MTKWGLTKEGFCSGMTAAYAAGRSNVITTLAGVAIAAALVPPLAVTVWMLFIPRSRSIKFRLHHKPLKS